MVLWKYFCPKQLPRELIEKKTSERNWFLASIFFGFGFVVSKCGKQSVQPNIFNKRLYSVKKWPLPIRTSLIHEFSLHFLQLSVRLPWLPLMEGWNLTVYMRTVRHGSTAVKDTHWHLMSTCLSVINQDSGFLRLHFVQVCQSDCVSILLHINLTVCQNDCTSIWLHAIWVTVCINLIVQSISIPV